MIKENNKTDIQKRYIELDRTTSKRRHDALVASNKIISAETRPLFEAIQKECLENGGHEWKFDHFNWDGSYQWDKCKWCGAREGADRHSKVKD